MAKLKLAHNATVAKLIDPPHEIETLVSELLSYQVEGASHSFAFSSGNWDGKSSFYSFKTHSFPAGFVFLVHKELTRRGHNVLLLRRSHAEPKGPENPIVDEFGNDDPRYDYQMTALARVEKYGRGIIQVATGGGKSKIAKLIMARYRRMTLFLTTRGVLLHQMNDQLVDIGLNTGIIGDGELKVTRGVNLGMVQTLAEALEEPDLDAEHRAIVKSLHRRKNVSDEEKNQSWAEIREIAKQRYERKVKRRNAFIKILGMIEVVIGEEAHEAGGASYFKILQHCKNASIRVALTATPFMRASAEDNMRLMAAFGPVLIKISEKMLIERGILAQPYFLFHDSEAPKKLYRSSPWERAYKLGYVENEHMHADIVDAARKARKVGLPVLTLVMRKSMGEALLAEMTRVGLKAVFLRGENDNDERKRCLQALAAGDIHAVIGTNILDVGVDVPAVGLVQLAGGGKAEVSLRQRIGRGLRAKKNGPNVAFVIDYSVAGNLKLGEHARQRRNIIENTPGFAEGILQTGQDFDWSQFKKQAA